MLTVAEAIEIILTQVLPPSRISEVSLTDALGRGLVEDINSDVDSPPFDKALMDGFAVRLEDVATGRAELRLLEEVMAGQVPQETLRSGHATRIMTGAPIPEGTEAVVRVEDTSTASNAEGTTVVSIDGPPVKIGQNIMKRGASTRVGDRVVSAGTVLRPQEIGAMAEAGQDRVSVLPRPRVAILATGDELVPVGCQPAPGQIRNSNESMLAAQMKNAGAEPVLLGIARDNPEHLRERIDAGLGCDLLLLSGGVSAGVLDLVPSVLESAGVRPVFHKVQVKPGKPLWFGVAGRSENDASSTPQRCYVFGLPGNPVSSMVCCELFVRTALRRLSGIVPAEPTPVPARLNHNHSHQGNRPTYHPASTKEGSEGRTVKIVPWQGSSDLRATTAANCMVYLPAGKREYAAGSVLDVFPW